LQSLEHAGPNSFAQYNMKKADRGQVRGNNHT
jgi:hypothetical protein